MFGVPLSNFDLNLQNLDHWKQGNGVSTRVLHGLIRDSSHGWILVSLERVVGWSWHQDHETTTGYLVVSFQEKFPSFVEKDVCFDQFETRMAHGYWLCVCRCTQACGWGITHRWEREWWRMSPRSRTKWVQSQLQMHQEDVWLDLRFNRTPFRSIVHTIQYTTPQKIKEICFYSSSLDLINLEVTISLFVFTEWLVFLNWSLGDFNNKKKTDKFDQFIFWGVCLLALFECVYLM